MSIAIESRNAGALDRSPATRVRVVKPLQFDDHTPQTFGMRRLVAVSHNLVGSESMWAGVMLAEPNSSSSVHHHGPLETVVYVLSGKSIVRWGSRLEHEAELEPGDFVFIPPYMPHQEINTSDDEDVVWVVMRSGPEAVVDIVTKSPDGEYIAEDCAYRESYVS